MTGDLLDAVTERLDAVADPATREWWERYLKGAVPFVGVKMAGVRRIAASVMRDHLASQPPRRRIDLALECFSLPRCEEKLVGVLLLAEHLLDDLALEDVPRLAGPLERGHVTDWNTCDWFGVKVLGPFVLAGDDAVARAGAVAGWRASDVLWLRRAAAVAFVNLAADGDGVVPGLVDLVLDVCEANVADPTRWSQTSVGWVLRELSAAAPDRVVGFVEAHPELSAEARRTALARL
ncbi:MAG TPA: DNA alkylation repair protein [Acidimicrobiia bacterium]|nr:DNA alkylation repair protein [Acidimicrobiia bacterium]